MRAVGRLLLAAILCALGGWRPASSAGESGESRATAARALDRWAAALGGRGRLGSVRTIHVSGSFRTGGLEGTFERWVGSAGSLRTEIEVPGAFRQVIVFDGHQGWMSGPGGTVEELAGATLETVVASAYEASFSFLFPGRLPGRVELAGEPAPGAPVLRLLPEGGSAVTVYLDGRTFLPSREESRGPTGARTIAFGGWKEYSGVRLPSTVSQSTGDRRLDAVFATSSVEIDGSTPADLFVRPAASTSPIAFAAKTRRAVVPVEVSMQHVFVPVRVDGAEAGWFFLDSGAALSFVSPELAKRSGLDARGAIGATGTGAGATMIGMAGPAVFRLPGLDVPMAAVGVWDFSSILPALGRAWDGDLGHDVIGRLVVRVDYARREVAFEDPETFVADPRAAVLPVTMMGAMPIVRAQIVLPGRAGIELDCAIDSGASGFHLSTPFATAHRVAGAIGKTISASSIGAGGATRELAGRLAALRLGPYRLRGPIVEFSPDLKDGLLAGPEIGGLIGGEILERFVVTFDLPHRRIYLEPNDRFADPFLADESGLSTIATGEGFRRIEVDDVEPGSPADAAGLRRGDVVRTIDGLAAAELGLEKLGALLRQEGRTIRVGVERGGRPIETSLALRERL